MAPTQRANAGMTYLADRVPRIGALDFGTANTNDLYSNYGLNLNWSLDSATMFRAICSTARQPPRTT